jgi:hypothetical protein
VRQAENEGVGVAVDGENGAGRAHAHCVLECARDAAGDIEERVDGRAGLADLQRPRRQARFDRAA